MEVPRGNLRFPGRSRQRAFRVDSLADAKVKPADENEAHLKFILVLPPQVQDLILHRLGKTDRPFSPSREDESKGFGLTPANGRVLRFAREPKCLPVRQPLELLEGRSPEPNL